MYDPAHDRAETGDLGGARPGRGLRYGGGITAAAMSGTEANGRPGLAVDCGYLSTISWRSEETPAFYAVERIWLWGESEYHYDYV
jgi:hypothetical protein